MTPWIIGNWKLNPESCDAVQQLINDLADRLDDIKSDAKSEQAPACQLMVAPSYLHLSTAKSAIDSCQANIMLASQDVSALSATTGAYTGDVSATQLRDMGATWVILGHSERRQYYSEDNDTLLQKLTHCAEQQLGSILCIGESEADFEAGDTEQVLAQQLAVVEQFIQQLHSQASEYASQQLIIAYEPVWAIGTGKVPSVEDVAKVHNFIRKRLQSFDEALSKTPIIYGGSVKPENAKDFAALDSVDGVLVGGAALNADSFVEIAQCFE